MRKNLIKFNCVKFSALCDHNSHKECLASITLGFKMLYILLHFDLALNSILFNPDDKVGYLTLKCLKFFSLYKNYLISLLSDKGRNKI